MYSEIYCTSKVSKFRFFRYFAQKWVFFYAKIAKMTKKCQKIDFFSIFSKVPQMFLKGLWVVLGVPGGSKRAIFAYLGEWKLGRFRFKSIISVLVLENFKQEMRVTLSAKRYFRLGHLNSLLCKTYSIDIQNHNKFFLVQTLSFSLWDLVQNALQANHDHQNAPR